MTKNKGGSRAREIEAESEAAEYRRLPISDLKPWSQNPRRKMASGSKRLASTILEVGWGADVIVQKGSLRIIGGHLRLMAAERLGITSIPCKILDVDDERARDLALADNQAATFAQNDPHKLQALLEEMHEKRAAAIGFERRDLDEILRQIRIEKKRAGDLEEGDVPPVPAKPKTKEGQIIDLGRHTIVCADSTDPGILPGVCAEAHLLVTDPPYNVAYVGKAGMAMANDDMSDETFRDFLRRALLPSFALLGEGRSFYVWHADKKALPFYEALRDLGQQVRQRLIWAKDKATIGRQDYQSQHEPCLYGWKAGGPHLWMSDRKQTTLFHHARPSRSVEHPTMKPVALIGELIENSTRPGETVVDPFLGSGTTLVACEELGRTCYGAELSPGYCDVIVSRWEKLTGEKAKRRRRAKA